jgi:hypothetical protein
MKVYSKSQGKLIDVDDQVSTKPLANESTISKMAVADVLATGGKNLSTINTLKGLLPSTEKKTVAVEEKKVTGLGESGLRTLSQVKDLYEKDPNVLTKQLIPGQYASRSFDTALYNTVDALLRLRTGAQANPAEIRGYMKKLGPTFGDSPDVVQQKLNNLEAEFAYQANKTAQGIKLDISQTPKKGLAETLFPATSKAFTEEGIITANPFVAKSAPISETKGKLGASLKATGQDLLRYLGLVAPAGGEIGMAAQTIKSIPGVTKTIGEKGSTLTIKGASANRATKAAASKAKFSGDTLIKQAEKYAEIDPTASSIVNKLKPSLANKTLTTKQLVDRIGVWNKAYTAAGKAAKSSKAGVYDILSKTARDLLSKKAPEVYKAQRQLAGALGRQKVLGKIINPISIGSAAATTAAITALKKMGIL